MSNLKECVKNEIILAMTNHLDGMTIDILSAVINKAFQNIEMAQIEMLPATVDDVNSEIIKIFNWKKRPKLSNKTADFYLESVNRLILFTNKSLLKITSMDIEMFLDSLKPNNTEVSLNNQRRNLSAFFTWMRKSHFIIENPCDSVEPYKEIQKPIDYLLPEEYEQLKSGCRTERDRALIEFLRSTAMRIGEVSNVKVYDVDWNNGKIKIYGSKTRTYRVVCLDSIALKYLLRYIKSRKISLYSQEALFASHKSSLTQAGMRSSIKLIRKRALIERRVYPHLFRKTTASNIIKRGGTVHDAGEYLGHKDNSTAGKYYAYISEEHTIEIFNKYVAIV